MIELRRWIVPYYCAGPFYMGWWTYLISTPTWDPAGTRESQIWLRWPYQLAPVRDLLVASGRTDIPLVPDDPRGPGHCYGFQNWFATTFPLGIAVMASPDLRMFTLLEVPDAHRT